MTFPSRGVQRRAAVVRPHVGRGTALQEGLRRYGAAVMGGDVERRDALVGGRVDVGPVREQLRNELPVVRLGAGVQKVFDERGVVAAVRGDYLRVSFAIFNDESDVDRGLEALRDADHVSTRVAL